LTLHSKPLNYSAAPLEVLARDATDTKVDEDVTRMLTMSEGSETVEEVEGVYEMRGRESEVGGWLYGASNWTTDKVVKVEIEFEEGAEYSVRRDQGKTEKGVKTTI
jgi:hypothetical protein